MACCGSCDSGGPCEAGCSPHLDGGKRDLGPTRLADDGISTGIPGRPAAGMEEGVWNPHPWPNQSAINPVRVSGRVDDYMAPDGSTLSASTMGQYHGYMAPDGTVLSVGGWLPLPDDSISTGIPNRAAPGMDETIKWNPSILHEQEGMVGFNPLDILRKHGQEAFQEVKKSLPQMRRATVIRPRHDPHPAIVRLLHSIKELASTPIVVDCDEEDEDEESLDGMAGATAAHKWHLKLTKQKMAAYQHRKRTGTRPSIQVRRHRVHGLMGYAQIPTSFDSLPPGWQPYGRTDYSLDELAQAFPAGSILSPEHPDLQWTGTDWSPSKPPTGSVLTGVPGTQLDGCLHFWAADGSYSGRWVCPDQGAAQTVHGVGFCCGDVGGVITQAAYASLSKGKKQRSVQGDLASLMRGDAPAAQVIQPVLQTIPGLRQRILQQFGIDTDRIEWDPSWKQTGVVKASYSFQTPGGPFEVKAEIRLDGIKYLLQQWAAKAPTAVKQIASTMGIFPLLIYAAQDKTVQSLAAQGVSHGLKATGLQKDHKKAQIIAKKAERGDKKAQKQVAKIVRLAQSGNPKAALAVQLMAHPKLPSQEALEHPQEAHQAAPQPVAHMSSYEAGIASMKRHAQRKGAGRF